MLNWVKRLLKKKWEPDQLLPQYRDCDCSPLEIYIKAAAARGENIPVITCHDKRDINPTSIIPVPAGYWIYTDPETGEVTYKELCYDLYYYNKHTGQIRREDFDWLDEVFKAAVC